jgi:hypothetical protein
MRKKKRSQRKEKEETPAGETEARKTSEPRQTPGSCWAVARGSFKERRCFLPEFSLEQIV